MKVLIVTQYFYPETFKSTELAFELQKRGHQVTVLTGLPNYPEGKIYKGYGVFKNRRQVIEGVEVIRSLLLPRGDGGGLRLFLNYYSFAFFASLKALFGAFSKKYDAIIVHEPSPITQFYPALLLHKLQKTPVYFWVMDLWPESLEIAGGVKNKFILEYYKRLVVKFYNNSEKILITSKGFKDSILSKGDFQNKIEYFPNWAENSIVKGDEAYSLPDLPKGFVVMFAGNVGEAQDMDNIMKTSLILREEKNIHFVILGSGRKMSYVKQFIEENELSETVHCLGRFPVEAMSSFFKRASLMLVSLKDDKIFNLTVPAKIQAYMAAARPIMAMLNGEGSDIIKEANCGFSVSAGDYKALAQKILYASKMDLNILNEMGENGKKYFLKYFELSSCIDNLERILNDKL